MVKIDKSIKKIFTGVCNLIMRAFANQRVRLRVERKNKCIASSVFVMTNLYTYGHACRLQNTRKVQLVAYIYLLAIYMNKYNMREITVEHSLN